MKNVQPVILSEAKDLSVNPSRFFAPLRMTLLIFLFSSAISVLAWAADKDDPAPSVGSLTSRVIPRVSHVGDEVRLVIQAQIPRGFSLEPISGKTKFAPFELRSIDKPLAVKRGEHILQTVIIRLTIFETGDFQVPATTVAVWNVAGQRAEALTPPLPVKIISIGKSKDDKADIRPIKGPANVSLRYLYDMGFGVLAFLLGGILITLVLRRHRRKKADWESLLPADQRLARELERLLDNHWVNTERSKEHYSELSDILRRYFERRYGLELMEHTSIEITQLLKDGKLPESVILDAREILETSDLVKFAKLIPERSVAADLENRLRRIAEATKPEPQKP